MRVKPLLPGMSAPKMGKPVKAIPGARVVQRIPTGKPKAPKRPSGQFGGKREATGQMNGGGYADVTHPQTHEDFEKL